MVALRRSRAPPDAEAPAARPDDPHPAPRRGRHRRGGGSCPARAGPPTSPPRRNTRPPPPRSAACSRSWRAGGRPPPGHRSAGTSCKARSSAWIPLAWLRAGLVTNPGMFVLGQPGTGKSTLVKRLVTGSVATGGIALILGDTKPDYTLLAEHLGGQVIRIGRGLDRINPLDAGPLGQALRRMSGPDAAALRWEVRSRRLSLLMALCTLVREERISNAEEVILGRAIDLLDERLAGTASRPSPTSWPSSSRAPTSCAPRPGLPRPAATSSAPPGSCSPSTCCAPARWPACSTAPPPTLLT